MHRHLEFLERDLPVIREEPRAIAHCEQRANTSATVLPWGVSAPLFAPISSRAARLDGFGRAA
ncbi:MAG: hypothetical protein R3F17_07575 [Planctomycetota bacterium]